MVHTQQENMGSIGAHRFLPQGLIQLWASLYVVSVVAGLLESSSRRPSVWPEEPTNTQREPASFDSPPSSPTSTMTTTL